MRKKITAFLLTIAMVLSTSTVAMAAGDAVITFDGDAGKFVTQLGGTSEGFENMDPGETREIKLQLVNDHASEMKFHLSGSIGENIADKGDQIAVYDISISKDSQEPFFQGMIGGTGSVGERFLGENFLLATLSKDESVEVTLAITLDGDSTGNDYQNENGNINLALGVEEITEEISVSTEKNYIKEGDTYKRSTTYVTGNATGTKAKNAKTGDDTKVMGFAAAAILGGGVLLLLLVGKRKRRMEE